LAELRWDWTYIGVAEKKPIINDRNLVPNDDF